MIVSKHGNPRTVGLRCDESANTGEVRQEDAMRHIVDNAAAMLLRALALHSVRTGRHNPSACSGNLIETLLSVPTPLRRRGAPTGGGHGVQKRPRETCA